MRHPSIRGVGIRFLLGSCLPVIGLVLVLWTATQLFTALASRTVPPPRLLVQATLGVTSLPAARAVYAVENPLPTFPVEVTPEVTRTLSPAGE